MASLLVAVFHIWLRRVSGGVDVFFVVSSFLITTGLLAQVERDGYVRFAAFWTRLIQRLIPAAMLVLCAVVVAGILLMPKSRWKDTIEQVAAAAVYLENWLLAFRAVDYLAQHENVSPVQHFWALSVQGQFYLLWPCLFAAAITLARRTAASWRTILRAVLITLFCASLAYSIWFTNANQPFAYFHTLTRLWEFCAGALLAMIVPQLQLPRPLRFLLGWLGLVAILSCGLVLQVSRVFPGYAALWPVLAAACIIVAGSGNGRFAADRLLGAKPMVYLGGISYAIYLWHFPLLTFARVWTSPLELGMAANFTVLLGSIALAALTTRWLEAPLRAERGREVRPLRALGVGIACAAPVVLGLSLWSYRYISIRRHDPPQIVAHPSRYPGAAAFDRSPEGAVRGETILPNPTMVEWDMEFTPGCEQDVQSTVPKKCVLYDAPGQYTVAIVGGSHSSQWIPALSSIGRQSGWDIVSFAKSNCPFHLGDDVGAKFLASCQAWNKNVVAQLVALRPAAVFTTSTRFDGSRELVPQGYIDAWRALEHEHIRVIALRDNPDFEFDVSACVELHGKDDERCSLPRESVLASRSPTEELIEAPRNVRFIDLSNYFCDGRVCPPVAGNVLIYRHMNHITATYVRTLTPMLDRELKQALTAD